MVQLEAWLQWACDLGDDCADLNGVADADVPFVSVLCDKVFTEASRVNRLALWGSSCLKRSKWTAQYWRSVLFGPPCSANACSSPSQPSLSTETGPDLTFLKIADLTLTPKTDLTLPVRTSNNFSPCHGCSKIWIASVFSSLKVAIFAWSGKHGIARKTVERWDTYMRLAER